MKKIISTIALLGSIAAMANDHYDYREQSELNCTSTEGSKISLTTTVQNETKIGVDGWPKSNVSKISVKINGKIDGQNINISKNINIAQESKSRLAISPVYSLASKVGSIESNGLSELTGDDTTPGRSTKITIKNSYQGLTGVVNIVSGAGQGFVSLSIKGEHFGTIPVNCTNKMDSADMGEDYFAVFQK